MNARDQSPISAEHQESARQRCQEGMRLLARLLEKLPGLVFMAPEFDADGTAYIALVVSEKTPELMRQIPPNIRRVPIRVRTSSMARAPSADPPVPESALGTCSAVDSPVKRHASVESLYYSAPRASAPDDRYRMSEMAVDATKADSPSDTSSEDVDHRPTFAELGLLDELLRAVDDMGFEMPTPIQARSIPAALQGRDILGSAHTGSGKTAAFALPSIQRVITEGVQPDKGKPLVLVLAPTRELVLQIQETFEALGQGSGIRTVSIVGGMSMNPQIRGLGKAPHVAVCTPGRLLDHMRQRNVSLSNVSVLILDEADRMLDMGFQDQLDTILRAVPKTRQTMLFSATMDHAISALARTSVKDPVQADVSDEIRDIPQVDLTWIEVVERQKRSELRKVIESEDGTVLVFVNMKQRATLVSKWLANEGIPAGALHGGLDQKERLCALDAFREGDTRVLIATDVAARGIDVEGIAHIVNFDMPFAAEDFIHRIGRTARAGATGSATNFVTVSDRVIAKRVIRMIEEKRAVADDTPEEPSKPKFGRRARKVVSKRGPRQATKLF